MTITQNKIISFFIQHPDSFRTLISRFYSFDYKQIIQYCDFLDYDLLTVNTSIKWNSEILQLFKKKEDWESLTTNSAVFKNVKLIDEFFDYIHWQDPNQNLFSTLANNRGVPWSKDLIEKYEKHWDYYQMSYNMNIPWSGNLIDRHLNEWHWGAMSGNEKLPWSLGFFEKYQPKIETNNFFFEINPAITGNLEIIEKYPQLVSWHFISADQNLPWKEKNLLELWKDKIDWSGIAANEYLTFDIQFFEKHVNKWLSDFASMKKLSTNKALPWSISFIERFKNKWNWDRLSMNTKLPWSHEFIDYFINDLHWGTITLEEIDIDEFGNEVLFEPVQMGKVFHTGLESNESIPWSLDLIHRYEHKLNFELLMDHEPVWKKAFKPYVDDKLIDTVLRII